MTLFHIVEILNKLINMHANTVSKEEELMYIVKRVRQCERIYVLEELKEFRLLIRRARSDSKRKLDTKVKASSTASIAAKNTSYHLLH